MKRSLLLFISLFVVMVVLAACQGGTNSDGEVTESDNEGNTEETTKVVEDAMGETEIPVNPKRIVSQYYLGHLLTLGITPVGTLQSELDSPFLQDKIEGIESIGTGTVSIETVIALEPDLIIAADPESYEQLSKIAPTVYIEYGKNNAIEELAMLGEILGKEEEAAQWTAQFEEKAANAKEQLAGVVAEGETVTVFEIWANNLYVYGNKWGRGGYNLYNVLDFTPPDFVKENLIDNQPYAEISLETLPEIAGDHIFLSVYEADGGDQRAEEIKQTNIWKSLEAVQNNQVYEVNLDDFFNFDPISLDKQLDIQVDLMLSQNQ